MSANVFAAPCEACELDRRTPPAIVQGTLRSEADVGFVTCWRGHRVRVKRITRRVVAYKNAYILAFSHRRGLEIELLTNIVGLQTQSDFHCKGLQC